MTQPVKTSSQSKAGDLGSIPGTYVKIEGKN